LRKTYQISAVNACFSQGTVIICQSIDPVEFFELIDIGKRAQRRIKPPEFFDGYIP
jgi:hypothetical protein